MFKKIAPYLITLAVGIVAVLLANYIQGMIDSSKTASSGDVTAQPAP